MLQIKENQSRYGVCLFISPKGHTPQPGFSTEQDNKITIVRRKEKTKVKYFFN